MLSMCVVALPARRCSRCRCGIFSRLLIDVVAESKFCIFGVAAGVLAGLQLKSVHQSLCRLELFDRCFCRGTHTVGGWWAGRHCSRLLWYAPSVVYCLVTILLAANRQTCLKEKTQLDTFFKAADNAVQAGKEAL